MHLRAVIVLAGMLIGSAAIVAGQEAIVQRGELVTATATIEEIDAPSRLITFKNEDGTEETVWVGPEFKRFDELQVGDKVTMSYYESTVYKLRKPGDPPLAPKDQSGVTGTTGSLPGGTATRQTVKTVTVKEVDPQAGTISVVTDDGRSISRTVQDKSILRGVKAGDKIDVVFTRALLASVERK